MCRETKKEQLKQMCHRAAESGGQFKAANKEYWSTEFWIFSWEIGERLFFSLFLFLWRQHAAVARQLIGVVTPNHSIYSLAAWGGRCVTLPAVRKISLRYKTFTTTGTINRGHVLKISQGPNLRNKMHVLKQVNFFVLDLHEGLFSTVWIMF